MIFPVILSGGAGTRLWPLSRSGYPKQFLPLTGKRTLFQQTLVRLEGLNCAPSIFICNETHRFLVAEQISQVDVKHNGIILEPIARDTGPAIALAAIHALNKDADAMLLVLPTDHIIENITEFHDAVNIAMQHAQDDKLVTFGIVPDKPETGYGYIKRGQAYNNAFKVNEFVEKPNIITAIDYITSKNYYWNSGMFMFKAARYLEILKQYCPSIYNVCKNALNNQVLDLDFIRINEEEFSDCPSKSVDFAVMEPAAANEDDHVIVVPLNAGWRDIGSFNALLEVSQLDEHGNSFMGDVKAINTQNTLIRAETRLIATVGVEDLIIIDTKDSLLIAHKAHAQDVKHIVNKLKQENRSEVESNREVYRPWGKYDNIDSGKRFNVKRITVNVGAKLSVQMHHHRSEHWVIVKGTAKVIKGDEVILLSENQSIYIPLGTIHALENPGKIPLELIEVQTGTYLEENDIIRFEDEYGRV